RKTMLCLQLSMNLAWGSDGGHRERLGWRVCLYVQGIGHAAPHWADHIPAWEKRSDHGDPPERMVLGPGIPPWENQGRQPYNISHIIDLYYDFNPYPKALIFGNLRKRNILKTRYHGKIKRQGNSNHRRFRCNRFN